MLLWLPIHTQPSIENYGAKSNYSLLEKCELHFVLMHLEITLLHMTQLFVTSGINFKILKEMAQEHWFLQELEAEMYVCLLMRIRIKIYGVQ